jgi:cation transport ATPase
MRRDYSAVRSSRSHVVEKRQVRERYEKLIVRQERSRGAASAERREHKIRLALILGTFCAVTIICLLTYSTLASSRTMNPALTLALIVLAALAAGFPILCTLHLKRSVRRHVIQHSAEVPIERRTKTTGGSASKAIPMNY